MFGRQFLPFAEYFSYFCIEFNKAVRKRHEIGVNGYTGGDAAKLFHFFVKKVLTSGTPSDIIIWQRGRKAVKFAGMAE